MIELPRVPHHPVRVALPWGHYVPLLEGLRTLLSGVVSHAADTSMGGRLDCQRSQRRRRNTLDVHLSVPSPWIMETISFWRLNPVSMRAKAKKLMAVKIPKLWLLWMQSRRRQVPLSRFRL